MLLVRSVTVPHTPLSSLCKANVDDVGVKYSAPRRRPASIIHRDEIDLTIRTTRTILGTCSLGFTWYSTPGGVKEERSGMNVVKLVSAVTL